jgi:hypothetical protein
VNLQTLVEQGDRRVGDEPSRGIVPASIARLTQRPPGSFCSPPLKSQHQGSNRQGFDQPVVVAATNARSAY